jgi:hypothetical protein
MKRQTAALRGFDSIRNGDMEANRMFCEEDIRKTPHGTRQLEARTLGTLFGLPSARVVGVQPTAHPRDLFVHDETKGPNSRNMLLQPALEGP